MDIEIARSGINKLLVLGKHYSSPERPRNEEKDQKKSADVDSRDWETRNTAADG